jgi:CheY-like chemotaxis protein
VGCKVLVVDDNFTNRRVLQIMGSHWGMTITDTENPETAIQYLQQAVQDREPYSIAILDMNMPDMDGEKLGRLIKEDPTISGVHLVMMTSSGQRGDAFRLAEIGFDAYLTKPVRENHLRECLLQVLSGHIKSPDQSPAIITKYSVLEEHRKRIRILLAEDNQINQKVALRILAKLGYHADAVGNGHEAIHALQTIAYDLVLMDIQMPEMDGFEATTQIRNPETGVLNPQVPIIAMTAHALHGDKERCLESGMNGYVSKPVEPGHLVEEIERLLNTVPS